MDFTPHEKLLDKIYEDFDEFSNEQYVEKLNTRIEILIRFVNSLFVDKIQMPAWKTFSETIIIKICFHIASLLKLFHGTELPIKHAKSNYIIFDEPSIYSLFRTITENYLTFFYLFIDNISDDEKYFRFLIYEYCGIHQRQSFDVTLPKNKQKQIDEAGHLEKLKTAILNSVFYKDIDPSIKKALLNGVKPRLKTWKKLIKDAQLNIGYDSNLYGFKSSYSHSEYLSLLQIRTNTYQFNSHERKSHFVLFIIHMLISRMIINLSTLFPTIKNHFEKLEQEMKIEIEFLSINLALTIKDPKNGL